MPILKKKKLVKSRKTNTRVKQKAGTIRRTGVASSAIIAMGEKYERANKKRDYKTMANIEKQFEKIFARDTNLAAEFLFIKGRNKVAHSDKYHPGW